MHGMRSPKLLLAALVLTPTLLLASPVRADAADCSKASVGLTALPDLASGTYKGEPGGLYPGGTNEPPRAYAAEGIRAAAEIVPLDAGGAPSATGKVVLMSIGMSNTTQEFSGFVGASKTDPSRASHVVVVDGAQGGQDARVWADRGAKAWGVAEDRLRVSGVTPAQVQAIWLKQAVIGPRGDFATSTRELTDLLATIVSNATQRYPNLKQVFVSSRTYAGYATTQLNPEPYAYESGFAVRDLIARSIAAPTSRPWIGWGPYLWTNGTAGRSSGFTWTCDDVAQDGTHPSPSGRNKVARLLSEFFGTSTYAAWYRGDAPSPVASEEPPLSERATDGSDDAATTSVGADADLWRWAIAGAAFVGMMVAGWVFLLRRA